jgi:hypothetical protein
MPLTSVAIKTFRTYISGVIAWLVHNYYAVQDSWLRRSRLLRNSLSDTLAVPMHPQQPPSRRSMAFFPRTARATHVRGWLVLLLLISACSDPAGLRRPRTAITYLEQNSAGVHDLVVVSAEDGKELARYPLPFLPDEAQLSPNHQQILLSDRTAGSISVNVVGGATKTVVSEVGAAYPEWSADGQKILYYSPQNGGSAWVIDADGSNAHPIVAGVPAVPHQYDPIWSPDGTRIAFNSDVDRPGVDRVYVMNADGSDTRLLPLDATIVTGDAVEVSWSPDGRQIAFESQANGHYAIFIANADGSGARRLTDGSTMQLHPWWSPDGNHLAFVSPVKPQYLWRVQIIDVATGTARLLTTDVSTPVDHLSPHWIEWP